MKFVFYTMCISIMALVFYFGFIKINKPAIVSNCNYELPAQYFLVKEKETNKYAIMFNHIDRFPHYLYYKSYSNIQPFYSNMGSPNEASLFDDSCTAKGFAFLCLYEMGRTEKQRNFDILYK